MPLGQRKIIIAIDGYSACGKSTLASALAKRLNYLHVDSGAMYRAVSLYVIQNNIAIANPEEMTAALANISIHLSFENDTQITWLNHENVEQAIRKPDINQIVSNVSALTNVRKEMVAQQRRMGAEKGIVMDGRDIGTVVFPKADLKLFLVSELEVRVERRWLELNNKGIVSTKNEIKENLLLRDHIDSTRSDSPLIKADDATEIDTSYLTPAEQLQIAYDLARSVIGQ